jgi:DNA-binding response OmpR family regulator
MIMVVVHDLDSRKQISQFLKEHGYEVDVPEHRQDVLPRAEEINPLVIVLDFYVADPDGLQVLKQLRERGYTGKVIAIAGESMRSVIPEASHLGIDQIVGGPDGKVGPLLLDQLEATIRLLFRQQILERAYTLYEQRGRHKGFEQQDWFEAEQQILKPHLRISLASS